MTRTHILALWSLLGLLALSTAFSDGWLWYVQAHQNDALSALICHAEHVVRTQPGVPDKQRHEAIRFYQQQIRLEHLKPCSS